MTRRERRPADTEPAPTTPATVDTAKFNAPTSGRASAEANSGQRQAATNASTRFLRVEGPGRCSTCSWHVKTQGHHHECPGGVETPNVTPPTDFDFVAEIQAMKAAEREAELTDPAQPHVAHAHLLPPRPDFDTLDWYMRVLHMFERCWADKANRDMFATSDPDSGERRANAKRLMQWSDTQRDSRDTDGDHAYALSALRREADQLARTSSGRNPKTNSVAYSMGAFVNMGWLTRGEVADELLHAGRAASPLGNHPFPDWEIRKAMRSGLDDAEQQGITRDV
jgi:hypothetical protein